MRSEARESGERKLVPGLAAVGGAGLAGLAAAAGACCVPVVAPLTVSILGAGGAAWAAGLGPYSLPLLILSGALLAGAHWSIRRSRRRTATQCRTGGARLVSAILWASTLLWALSAGVNAWLG